MFQTVVGIERPDDPLKAVVAILALERQVGRDG